LANSSINGARTAIVKTSAWNDGRKLLKPKVDPSKNNAIGTLTIAPEARKKIFSLKPGL
jgi:hypothetical protein